MKIVFFIALFISVSLSAQQKEKRQRIPKTDTVRMKKPDAGKKNINPASSQKDLYKMPNLKPARDSVYSGMKDKRKDTTDYKILNGMIPQNKNNAEQK
jgi:hypothetical protein